MMLTNIPNYLRNMLIYLVILVNVQLISVHCKAPTEGENTFDSLYEDLFTVYRNDKDKPTMPRPGPDGESQESTGAGKPATDSCCGTTRTMEPFLEDHRDRSGVLWHAVWFNGTSFKAQYYEKVSCGNEACSLVKTLRPFVMTRVIPHRTLGHAHAMLNSNWLNNVKFLNHFVGGYCVRKEPSRIHEPISSPTRRPPRTSDCIRSRLHRIDSRRRRPLDIQGRRSHSLDIQGRSSHRRSRSRFIAACE